MPAAARDGRPGSGALRAPTGAAVAAATRARAELPAAPRPLPLLRGRRGGAGGPGRGAARARQLGAARPRPLSPGPAPGPPRPAPRHSGHPHPGAPAPLPATPRCSPSLGAGRRQAPWGFRLGSSERSGHCWDSEAWREPSRLVEMLRREVLQVSDSQLSGDGSGPTEVYPKSAEERRGLQV
ncbi:translation initiation factor IF-2-like [Choloepus didactylus]|uniref:translation initiation factor IF-2-like n=1 Tax=Choloepus didactylus TaxID=27675 RepID=UPI00189D88B3|nr:translation initiation factor IF-2-like [Choloepus didactylus]